MSTEPLVLVERDAFCGQCGQKIDRMVANIKYKDSGLAESLILGDSLRIHRTETGCSGENGWQLGPWEQERAARDGEEWACTRCGYHNIGPICTHCAKPKEQSQ